MLRRTPPEFRNRKTRKTLITEGTKNTEAAWGMIRSAMIEAVSRGVSSSFHTGILRGNTPAMMPFGRPVMMAGNDADRGG
jgi:hypothetical protein